MIDELARDLRLVKLGVMGELRNPAFRLLAVVFAVGAAIYAWNQGPLAGNTGLFFSMWAGRVFAVAACLWFATGAIRDQNAQLGAVLRSKPIDGARWVMIIWATGIGLWLVLMGALFLGAALGQLVPAGFNSLLAHGIGFVRAALVMVPIATLGFGLSRLSRSPLGAAVVVLALLCVLAGLQFVPQFLRPDYTQNLALFAGAGLVLLALAALLVERWRRGELRKPLLPAVGVAAALLLATGGAALAFRAAQPPKDGTVEDMISRQYLEKGKRIPGFWLPDGRGNIVRTADHAGKILFIYLFGGDDLEAARSLQALDVLQRENRNRGVQVLGVCFSTDRGDGAALAWSSGLSFPVGTDPTALRTATGAEGSVATAYAVQALPVLVVTDRRRRAQEVLIDPSYDVDRLRALLNQRLSEEPDYQN